MADGVRAVSAPPHPRRSQLVPYEEAFEPRVGGECEGEWWIAPDFDTLPDDIAEAFGMLDTSKNAHL